MEPSGTCNVDTGPSFGLRAVVVFLVVPLLFGLALPQGFGGSLPIGLTSPDRVAQCHSVLFTIGMLLIQGEEVHQGRHQRMES